MHLIEEIEERSSKVYMRVTPTCFLRSSTFLFKAPRHAQQGTESRGRTDTQCHQPMQRFDGLYEFAMIGMLSDVLRTRRL